MRAHLASTVFAAKHRDAVVFLDVAADAYVIADDAEVFLSDDRTLEVACGDVYAELRTAGLIVSEPAPMALSSSPPPAGRLEIPFQRQARVSLADVLAFVRVLLEARLTFGRSDLAQLLGSVARTRRGTGAGETEVSDRDIAEAGRLASVFQTMLIWSPWQGRCLFRSFLLLNFLRARGSDARWIFGVRTWPFLAHCWLQAGDHVLIDDPQRLSAFSVLFAL